MATYKIAGPMVEVEKEILRKVASLIDYPKTFGGTFPTGGSMCNFMSLIIARDKKNPEIINDGKSQNLVCYSSKNSHYSIGKNASFAGIGRNNVRYIKTNAKGEMCSESLQTAIKNDMNNKLIPFFVNATVGTTVMGATDPMKAEEGTVRRMYGLSIDKNAIHGSDSVANGRTEIDFFFK